MEIVKKAFPIDTTAYSHFPNHTMGEICIAVLELSINEFLKQSFERVRLEAPEARRICCDDIVPMLERDLDAAMQSAGAAGVPEYVSAGSLKMSTAEQVVAGEGMNIPMYRCNGVGYTLIVPIMPGMVVVFLLKDADDVSSGTATVH